MQPLSDIKVLDFSRFLPAPFCSMMLGDFGADVIRIEQPREVQKQEQIFERTHLSQQEKQALKAKEMLARNKRSVLLNLRHEAGISAAKRMIKNCDVLIHDYRPGIMEAMGLGYKEVEAINPSIVYCAVSLCGQDGPYRQFPGHDPIALALAGALGRFGDGKKPHVPGLPVGDISTGLQALIGILLALKSKAQTGEGQLVDIAMSDSALGLMTSVMQRYLMDEEEPAMAWTAGNTGTWKCSDGKHICLSDLEPAYFEKFCKAVERTDLLDCKSIEERQQKLADLFLTQTRHHWFKLLRQAGTQVAPVYSLAEALTDEHALARKTIQHIDDGCGNTVVHVGPSIKLNKTPGNIRQLGHLAGADTEQVLSEFNFSETEIAVLKRLFE